MSKGTKTGDLYIAHTLHVLRDKVDAKGKPVPQATHTAVFAHPEPANIKTIEHGQLVSETDLTDEEVEKFLALGVLRAPSYEELQAMEARKDAKTGTEAQSEAEAERVRLDREQEIERQRLETETRAEAEKKKAKLAEDQAKEREQAEKKTGKKK